MGCSGIPCCRGKSTGSREVKLKLQCDQLIHDINNYAYIEGHVMGEDDECRRHVTIDIGQEGNIDRVSRILAVVHAGVLEMLYPYTKKEVEEEVIDNRFWEPEDYMIVLRVPETMSQTTMHLLCRLIHEYMVYRVLADWLSITKMEGAEVWAAKAEATAAEINRVKNLRRGALTRPMHPF